MTERAAAKRPPSMDGGFAVYGFCYEAALSASR